MRFRKLLVLAALAVVGCSTDDLGVSPRPSGSVAEEQPAPLTEAGSTAISLKLNVVGPVKIGVPVTIQSSLTANVDAPNVTYSIGSPELEAAKRSGNGRFTVHARELLPAAQVDRGSMKAGEQRTQVAHITILQPGAYRVIGRAVAAGVGPNVQPEGREELWLFVSEAGGVVRDTFDATLIPDSANPAPGPYSYRRSLTAAPAKSGTRALATASEYDLVAFFGLGIDSSAAGYTYVPVPNATVTVTSGSTSVDMMTDATGAIQLPCGSYPNWTAVLHLKNTRVYYDKWSSSAGQFSQYGPCGASYGIATTNAAATRIFMSIDDAALKVPSVFGLAARPAIMFKHLTYNDSIRAQYHTDTDFIDVFHNAVWSDYGYAVAAHEYGHSWYYKVLWHYTNVDDYCRQHHAMYVPTGLNCAWVEGFADYFAYAVGHPYRPDIETSFEQAGLNGSIDELYVATFLWDLADGANDDQVAGSANEIAYLLSACTVTAPSGTRHIEGIDDFAQCAEARVFDTSLFTSYFTSRPVNQRPSTQNQWAWFVPDQVRATWLHDLFGV